MRFKKLSSTRWKIQLNSKYFCKFHSIGICGFWCFRLLSSVFWFVNFVLGLWDLAFCLLHLVSIFGGRHLLIGLRPLGFGYSFFELRSMLPSLVYHLWYFGLLAFGLCSSFFDFRSSVAATDLAAFDLQSTFFGFVLHFLPTVFGFCFWPLVFGPRSLVFGLDPSLWSSVFSVQTLVFVLQPFGFKS